MNTRAAVLLTLLTFPLAILLAGEKKPYSHADYYEHYEGTKTCLSCHESDAESFFHSQHYQWQGEAPAIVNSKGRRLGKMNTINDFCTNPSANWIDLVRNSRGEIISKGCSACHAGMGLKPEPTISQQQLENIDCLVCHASGYRRDLYETGEGGYEWKPILWKNKEGLDSVSKRISMPKRTMCLRCHSASGGGPNWKRGDIEYTLRDPEPTYDVHMTKDGPDMQCVDCHAGSDHRVRGRGTDLSATDSPGARLLCSECHEESPHGAKVLDRHAEKVYCTTCHIPAFARTEPTDMVRDWSTPLYNEEKDKYSATITFEDNVEPVYTWYNGTTREQFMGEKIKTVSSGEVGIMVPQGSRDDPDAKLYAFKLHRGKLPMLTDKQWLIPIMVEAFFADGDIDGAVKHAAKETYGVDDAEYEWVDTVRYMGIFHSIPPADQALKCLDCHADDGRLDWEALGYKEDPMDALLKARRAKKPRNRYRTARDETTRTDQPGKQTP